MNVLVHSMLGLPSSGKTTFLAALWHVLTADEIECNFSLLKIEGDVKYLDTITEAWRTFQKVPRTTSMETEEKISVHVKNNLTQEPVVLEFPDISGETFERQLLVRSLDERKFETLATSSGLLLFVTADKPEDGVSISDLPQEARGGDESGEQEQKEWKAECVPQQVKIVELLQFIQNASAIPFERKVAVIISAWDCVQGFAPKTKPEEWLRREHPLLFQFLKSNTEHFKYQVFGLSAQGGEITTDNGKKKLAEKIEASTRITCVSGDKITHDITCPVLWLMSRE